MKLRGSITQDEVKEISSKLPNIEFLVRTRPNLDAELVSRRFAHNPKFPVAGTCLADAISTLAECRFAVYEASAHKIWYESHANEIEYADLYGLYTARFFCDDAALRLYAVGEYLAEAIIILLNINKKHLERQKNASLQNRVGEYLRTKFPNHVFTRYVGDLLESDGWRQTRDYRDRWVHGQPPLIEGLGRQFKRQTRWVRLTDSEIAEWQAIYPDFGTGAKIRMSLTSLGDKSELTIDDLLGDVRGALFAVSALTEKLVSYFFEMVKSQGKSI